MWKGFGKTYWEKRAVVLRGAAGPLKAFGPGVIFQLLLEYSDRCRKTGVPKGLKFYVSGQPQFDEEVLNLLPVARDRSLNGYHRRMGKLFRDYCLVCDELLQAPMAHWSDLSGFVVKLCGEVGLPNRYVEMGLYLGNYRKTPFGVHVDGCGVISVPVVGRKRFRIWESDFAKANPELQETHQYDDFKKDSKLLKAGPGDLVYWPSTAWHIAESDGTFNATWSLGFWLDESLVDYLLKRMRPLIVKGLRGDSDLRAMKINRSKNSELRLPKALERSVSALTNLSEDSVRDALTLDWLKRVSSSGFKTDPVVVVGTKGKVFWAMLSKGIAIAQNGRVIQAAYSAHLVKSLKRLNVGDSVRVEKFLNRQRPVADAILSGGV